MSYILEALRKSESERQQGRVPDFNQQVQMIHRPKRKTVSAVVWLALALVFNAVVMAFIFWPGSAAIDKPTLPGPVDVAEIAAPPASEPERAADVTKSIETKSSLSAAASETFNERPTVIVPSARTQPSAGAGSEQPDSDERIPHLIELPLSFQRSVPDLMFNSHIYASDPLARRVMINDQYLRAGDVFSGVRVDRITEEGVELSKNGKRFRVGVVRDWMTPR